jgi:hypothetical protein
MERWSRCPGSVRLSEGIPPTTSSYAEEGTRAHELAAALLDENWIPDEVLAAADAEMYEAVQVYVDAVKEASVQAKRLIEHRFDLSSLYPGLFGTCDAVIFDRRFKTLRVFDYKHGAGIPVEVVEDGVPNLQLSYYGLGALISTDFPCDWVELVIVQPRCAHPDGPIRRHTFPAIDMLDFATDLKTFAEKTADPNAPLVPGDHCRFCPARPICPKLQEAALEAGRAHFQDLTKAEMRHLLTPEKLVKALALLPQLESFISGIRELAYSELQAGRPVPGWKLVQKRATRRWRDEKDAEKFFRENFPQVTDLLFEKPSLKSVSQVEKALTKKLHSRFKDLVEPVSSGTTLVPRSDPRQEVPGGISNPALYFSPIPDEPVNSTETTSLSD